MKEEFVMNVQKFNLPVLEFGLTNNELELFNFLLHHFQEKEFSPRDVADKGMVKSSDFYKKLYDKNILNKNNENKNYSLNESYIQSKIDKYNLEKKKFLEENKFEEKIKHCEIMFLTCLILGFGLIFPWFFCPDYFRKREYYKNILSKLT